MSKMSVAGGGVWLLAGSLCSFAGGLWSLPVLVTTTFKRLECHGKFN